MDISRLMREIFESAILTDLYPKSQIDIYVQVLQADGGGFIFLMQFIVRS